MKKKSQLISFLLATLFVCVQSCTPNKAKQKENQEAQEHAKINYDSLINKIANAFATRDTALIRPLLASDFSISTQTWPTSRNMLHRIFVHSDLNCKVELSNKDVQKLSEGRAKVELKYIFEDTTKLSNITLDKNGKIEYVDYFDQQYGLFRDKPSKLVATIPFEYRNGEIVVKIKLNDNGKELNFLFDTGADGMAITDSLAKVQGLKVARSQSTSVVGGNVDVNISSGNTVHVGEVSLLNCNIAIFNQRRGNTDGILGLTLANRYIVNVDFDSSLIKLFNFGAYEDADKEHAVRITVPSGLAMIDGGLNVNGKEDVHGRFVFDTGAKFTLVCFNNYVSKNRLLVGGFDYDSVTNMTSFGQNTTIYNGQVDKFWFGNKQIVVENMPVSMQASSGNTDWAPDADGSLGIRFTENYNFTINLVNKEITFTSRK
ncbi:MAG: retropepsin-like aspartic protease [Bacteroidales bacterium]